MIFHKGRLLRAKPAPSPSRQGDDRNGTNLYTAFGFAQACDLGDLLGRPLGEESEQLFGGDARAVGDGAQCGC